MQQSDNRDSHQERNCPTACSKEQWTSLDFAEFEFHPRHEQRGRHTNREHRDHEAFEFHQSENVRTQYDAEHHFKDDDRYFETERDFAQQGRQHGGGQYPEDRVTD